MISNKNFDIAEFEKKWVLLAKEICQAIYISPKVQQLKQALQENGFLSLEEKSEFINICNGIKYELIYKKYGSQETESYKEFSKEWQKWFQAKGVESQTQRTQRDSVDHILFGSTPDPERFLMHFEEEMLGSIKQ